MSAPVVLVTGVTSTIGKAIVRRLAFAGYNVAAADRCSGDVSEVAANNKKVGGKVVGFAVDLAEKAHRSELISQVVSEMGKLDSLIVVPPDNDVLGDIIDTEVNQFIKVEGDGSGGLWNLKDSGEAQRHLESMIPLGRLGRPSDAAHLVQFLISDRARYITGENCLLNGGISFRL